jgi:hypothetical protein
MPRKAAVMELEAEAPTPNGVAHGFRPQESRRATADPERWPQLQPKGDGEPFWAEIRDDLTINEVERIPLAGETPLADVWAVIAPMVLAWNATGYNPTTNAWEPVPPPAEAGPDAFKAIPKYAAVTLFLAMCLKFHSDLNLPKGRKPSGATDAG